MVGSRGGGVGARLADLGVGAACGACGWAGLNSLGETSTALGVKEVFLEAEGERGVCNVGESGAAGSGGDATGEGGAGNGEGGGDDGEGSGDDGESGGGDVRCGDSSDGC